MAYLQHSNCHDFYFPTPGNIHKKRNTLAKSYQPIRMTAIVAVGARI
jgi:hypothetical protein